MGRRRFRQAATSLKATPRSTRRCFHPCQRTTMFKRWLFIVPLAVLGLACGRPSGAATIISAGLFTPTSPTFSVPIEITDAAALVTWQFDLAFDPADVQALSISEGPFPSSGGQ